MILIIDTSQKEARVALKDNEKLKSENWEAGRELSATILHKIDGLFDGGQTLSNLKGIIVNAGPGSYTGLRIGISIANAIAFALNIPVVGVANETDFEKLISQGSSLLTAENEFSESVVPFYGSEPNITQPKNK